MKITHRSNVFTHTSRKHFVVTANRHIIYCDDGVDIVDEMNEDSEMLQHEQKYSSKNTATNWKYGKTPALFKKIPWQSNIQVLDYGGGTEQSAALAQDFFENLDPTIDYVWYDKYWQNSKQQNDAIRRVKQNSGADVAMLSNVLNVIAEPEVRHDILTHIKSLLKPNGVLYIYGYEGKAQDQKNGGRTTAEDQYQTFMKTKDYLSEIHEVFPDAKIKNNVITAPNTNSKNVAASVMFDDDGRYEYVKSKSVEDSDGFLTDYTMYYDVLEDKYVFVFGDRDLYDPNDGYDEFDWECDTEQEANEWYYNYEGFIDDNIDVFESKIVVNCSTYGKYTYTMDIDFRGDVNVTENGVDIYENTFSFDPEPYRGDYYKDEDTGAKIISVDDILQYIDDILNGEDVLNANIGAHTISGVVSIVAEIDGVDYSEDFRGRDEDGDPTYDREFFTDDSESIIKSFDLEIIAIN